MPRRLVSPTVIGRSSELAAIRHALDGASNGTPIHQLVAGEAGVGKSRLVVEMAAIASGRGMRVLMGACADIGDGGVPYGPIVEAFRRLVRELDEDQLDAVIGAARPDLARLVPSLSPDGVADAVRQSESLQARLLDAVLSVLQRLAEASPVLFVIEDLHWSDPATRETIAFLIRQLRADRVLLVLTFRADELHRRHPLLPWLAELDRSGRVERIDLPRLGLDQTRELLAAILETPPSSELAEKIHRRSDGNPFFVEELIGAGEAGADGRLPPTLREVLLARIVALSESAQAVVGVAAVAGRRIDHDLLVHVTTMDHADLLDGLRTAVNSQVLVTGPGADGADGDYAFRHALLQEAAYDDLLPGERQRLHRAFAEALAERGPGGGAIAAGHWGELAYHWSAARDDRHAFEASIRAGEAAARAYAFADARRHDERALELWDTIDDAAAIAGMDRIALLDRAAVAAWLAGDARRSVALRREAVAALRAGGAPIRLGVMLEQLGRALWNNSETDAALEATQEAVSVIPADPPTPELARVLSGYGQMMMLLDRWSESLTLCEQAVALARDVGARQAEGHALNTLGLDLSAQGRAEEGIAALEAAIAIAEDVADPDDIGRGYVNFSEAKLFAGDTHGAADAVRVGIVATDEVGIARTYGRFVRENGIAVAYELGDWLEAARLADATVGAQEPARQQRRYGLTRWVALLVATADERADAVLEELRGLLEGSRVEAQFNTPYQLAMAEAALWRGMPDEALASIQVGIEQVAHSQWHWFHFRLFRVGMRAAAEIADVARARRDRTAERAAIEAGDEIWATFQPIFAATRPHQHGLDGVETDAEVAMIEAERQRMAGASTAASWSDVAARWLAREKPYLVAYCRWQEADALLRDGDRGGALSALIEAHAIATRLGARPLRAAVEGLAARSRSDLTADAGSPVPVAVAAADDPFGLTRRERDVLPLLVKGRTNKQIAEELFISENTAGVHVSNILGKLGASSRTEAAGIAARLGMGVE